MMTGLIACGGDKKEEEPVDQVAEVKEEQEASVDEEAPAEEAPASFEPVSVEWEECVITVVGAESFIDVDDKSAIRVYYDYTNTSEELDSAWNNLGLYVEQDGYEQQTTYEAGDWSDDYSILYVCPGITVRCVAEYTMKADGGPIKILFEDYWGDGESIELEFDPQNLPGAPSDVWEIEPITDPVWAADFALEGEVDEYYISMDSIELTEGYEEEPMVRVYFNFTNNSEEAISAWSATMMKVLQDGIQLISCYAMEDVPEDEQYNLDIEPGETARVSVCYELRSESPVEVDITSVWGNESVGGVFELN